MSLEVVRIYSSAESEKPQKGEVKGPTDIIVYLKNGEKYIASFFSFKDIEEIRNSNQMDGDYLNGKYFWSKNLVLVDNYSLPTIKGIINHLIEESDFQQVFEKL